MTLRFTQTLAFLLVVLASACREPLATNPTANVILITLDTTRADHLGAYGHESIATPALDGLAAEGVRFEQASTPTPLTLPAHASIMTGATPLEHGVRDNAGFILGHEEETLAEVLQTDGIATAAIIGAFVLQRAWGLDQGFDHYDDTFEGIDLKNTQSSVEIQRDAGEVVDRAIDWIGAKRERRFFAWLHFYDPHLPYEPPGEFAARYPGAAYVGEIAYVDSQIARLVAWLRENELYDRTLIVVTGDHGEALGEHREPDHGIFVYEATLHVPLIIRAPGGPSRRVVPELVRNIDLMPTILDYLELSVPPSVKGASLLGLMAGNADDLDRMAYSESFYPRFHYGWSELHALRDQRYKYIRAPRPELYDLQQDPGETSNLVAQHPGIAEDMAERLATLLEDDSAAEPAAIDPDTMERLKSLGYVGSFVQVDGELPDPKDKAGSLELFSRVGFWGTRFLKERRFDEALQLANEALAAEPNYLDGYQLKARALLGMERTDDARTVLEAALQLNPDDLGTLHELAKSHRAAGEYQTALDLLERIRSLSPEYAAAYVTTADTYVSMHRVDDAVALLEALLAVHPDSAIAAYEIGRLRLQQGRLDEARSMIERALEIRDLGSAHFNLALIAEEQGDLARAALEYEREVALYPRNHEGWVNLGLLRMRQNTIAAGVAAFERVVEIRPELSVGHFLLARAYLAQGRSPQEVLPLARRAVELDPASRPARALLQELERG